MAEILIIISLKESKNLEAKMVLATSSSNQDQASEKENCCFGGGTRMIFFLKKKIKCCYKIGRHFAGGAQLNIFMNNQRKKCTF